MVVENYVLVPEHRCPKGGGVCLLFVGSERLILSLFYRAYRPAHPPRSELRPSLPKCDETATILGDGGNFIPIYYI